MRSNFILWCGVLVALGSSWQAWSADPEFERRLNEARAVPEITNDNEKGGFELGVRAGGGQAVSTEPGTTPGLHVFAEVEPTYVVQKSAWNRFEFSLGLGYGQHSYRHGDYDAVLTTPFSGLVKFGYGYSLGDGLFGVPRVGMGPIMGSLKVSGNNTTATYNNAWGFAAQMGYDVVYKSGSSVDFIGGLSFTHLNINFSKYTSEGVTVSQTHNQQMNDIDLNLGLRFVF